MQKREKTQSFKPKFDLNSSEEREIEVIKSTFSCSICLSITEDPCMPPCGHLFCNSCLMKWIQTNNEPACPNCRSLFGVQSILRINNGKAHSNSTFFNVQKKILKPGFSSQNMKFGNLLVCKVENRKPSLFCIGITTAFSLILMIFAEVLTTNFKLERI